MEMNKLDDTHCLLELDAIYCYDVFKVQGKPLNVIPDNVIIHLI